jgi:hypothetical protein
MLNIIDDAFYTLDESVRSVRDLIENMRDDAPVDLCGGVRRQNPVLESRVREEGCVLCKHLLTVSSSLKGPEGNLEISLHFPSQRTNPFRQADFSKVIQSRYEPLLAGSAKLAKFGGIGASADFERRRDPRLGWPRSAQDTVERRESCLSHFASLSFLHVQAGAISKLQGTSVFGMPSNGLPNIISRETERLARCHATKDDMDMRVVRVPVNHRRPLMEVEGDAPCER